MTTDEILFIVLILVASAGVGLLALIAKDLHAYFSAHGAAPSAAHVVALTEAVEAHVAVGKVANEQTHGLVSRIEAALLHKASVPAAAPAPAPAAAADPHPAGMVAAPVVPAVMPSTAQPVAPADMAALVEHMRTMSAHLAALQVPAPVVVVTPAAPVVPEPVATPLVIADPAPTVQPTVAAA